MHHLENFSIRRVVRVGPTRAPPRGAPVAPLSIIRLSLSPVAARPAPPRGWRPPRHYRPRGHLALLATRARDPYSLKGFRLNTDLAGHIINLLRGS